MKKTFNNKSSIFLSQKKLLKEAGCDDYEKSTGILFSEATGIPIEKVFEYTHHDITKDQANLFVSMVNRRAVGEPISHIICSRAFWKNDFYTNYKVLDPRPESELIIDVSKKLLFDGMKVLDLGAGSGCLGISLFQENPKICLSLADSSNKALEISRKNTIKVGVTCKFIRSDLFSNIQGKFDLIVANLPYIEQESFLYLQKDIILYEPHEALYGGTTGLDLINFFLRDVHKHLNKKGIFLLEFGEGQHVFLEQELHKLNFNEFEFFNDLNGIVRSVCVKKDT